MGGERRRQKSLRIGVHHANGVVWGPVYRTHLTHLGTAREPNAAAPVSAASSAAAVTANAFSIRRSASTTRSAILTPLTTSEKNKNDAVEARQVRPIHWFPYDPVRVVNADP